MSKDTDSDGFRDRVDRAYALRAALLDARSARQTSTTTTSLARRLFTTDFSLTSDEWQYIKRDDRLRVTWEYLKRARTLAALPRMAAASSGDLTARSFENGIVTIIPSTQHGIVYVKIAWRPQPQAPRLLLLERDDTEHATRALPPLRTSGDFLLICDKRSSTDELFLRLLGDPRTHGSFLA